AKSLIRLPQRQLEFDLRNAWAMGYLVRSRAGIGNEDYQISETLNRASRGFEFNKRRQLLISTHSATLSFVAMPVNNENSSISLMRTKVDCHNVKRLDLSPVDQLTPRYEVVEGRAVTDSVNTVKKVLTRLRRLPQNPFVPSPSGDFSQAT